MIVGQRDLDALVRGDIDASDTRHVRLSSGYHGGKTPIGRRPKDDPTDYRHDHRQVKATPTGLSLGVAVAAPRHAARTRDRTSHESGKRVSVRLFLMCRRPIKK